MPVSDSQLDAPGRSRRSPQLAAAHPQEQGTDSIPGKRRSSMPPKEGRLPAAAHPLEQGADSISGERRSSMPPKYRLAAAHPLEQGADSIPGERRSSKEVKAAEEARILQKWKETARGPDGGQAEDWLKRVVLSASTIQRLHSTFLAVNFSCPGCGSEDTRFYDFNNMKQSRCCQPRYACKSCKNKYGVGRSKARAAQVANPVDEQQLNLGSDVITAKPQPHASGKTRSPTSACEKRPPKKERKGGEAPPLKESSKVNVVNGCADPVNRTSTDGGRVRDDAEKLKVMQGDGIFVCPRCGWGDQNQTELGSLSNINRSSTRAATAAMRKSVAEKCRL